MIPKVSSKLKSCDSLRFDSQLIQFLGYLFYFKMQMNSSLGRQVSTLLHSKSLVTVLPNLSQMWRWEPKVPGM